MKSLAAISLVGIVAAILLPPSQALRLRFDWTAPGPTDSEISFQGKPIHLTYTVRVEGRALDSEQWVTIGTTNAPPMYFNPRGTAMIFRASAFWQTKEQQ